MESIYSSAHIELTDYQQRTLASFEAQARVNHRVMRPYLPEHLQLVEGTPNPERVRKVCEALELHSLVEPLLDSIRGLDGFEKRGGTQ